MKIAFVYDAIYPWVKGGAEKRIYELGKRLASRGDDVHLFGVKWWKGEDVIQYEGMTLHGVCGPLNLYVNSRRSIREALIFSGRLIAPLLKERFDLIDVSVFPYFSCFAVKAVAVLRRTPVVFTWHEVWDDYWYEYMGKPGIFGWAIERMVSKISSKNIAVSQWTKNRLISIGLAPGKIHVVPNGIDLKRIANTKPSDKRCDIMFAGRLIKEKNVDVLLKAVAGLKADIPDIRCSVIGDGPEKDRLVKLSEELGISSNVEFSGFVEYDELIGRIRSSKIFTLPSSREGFGMIVIESFACAVAVITVNEKYNAAQGLIDEGVNGLITGLDPDQLACALRNMLQNSTLLEMSSQAAFEKAGNYEWDLIIPKLEYVYGEGR